MAVEPAALTEAKDRAHPNVAVLVHRGGHFTARARPRRARGTINRAGRANADPPRIDAIKLDGGVRVRVELEQGGGQRCGGLGVAQEVRAPPHRDRQLRHPS